MDNPSKIKTQTKASSFTLIVAFICVALIGLALIPLLPVKLNPSRTLPGFTVQFSMPGTSSRVVEIEATSKLEAMLARIKGIKNIYSTSDNGSGSITIELDKYADIDAVRFEASTIIRQTWPQLPDGVSYPYIRMKRPDENASRPFMSFTLNAPSTPILIQQYADEHIKTRLAQIQGIYKIDLSGATPMEWVLEYDSEQLRRLGITLSDIQQAVSRYYLKEFLGTYNVESSTGGKEWIRLALMPETKDEGFDASRIRVKSAEGKLISLDELVTVSHMEEAPQSYYRINGLNSIYLSITAEETANQLQLSKQVKEEMEAIQKVLPTGYEIHTSYDATEFIHEELNKIYLRTGLTVLILLFFVLIITLNPRYLFLIVVSLSINIAVAVIFYYLFGLEMQLYSLAGITVSLNLVIDNTIVMTDHILHRRNLKAFMSILAATLTTMGALVIIFFLDEKIRLNLQDFAAVVIINLAVSLFVALFFVPALIEKIGLKKRKRRRTQSRFFLLRASLPRRITVYFTRFYGWMIRKLCRWRVAVCILLILLFGLPVFMLPDKVEGEGRATEWYNKTLGSSTYKEKIKPIVDKALGGSLRLFIQKVYNGSYFTRNEEVVLYVYANLPNGSTLEQMNELIKKMEIYLSQFKEIKQFQTSVYNARRGNINIYFTKEHQNSGFPYTLKANIISKALQLGGGSWGVYGLQDQGFSNDVREGAGSFQVKMYGYNYDELYEWAEKLKAKLLTHRRIKEVIINSYFSYWKDDYQEFYFNLNRERMAQENINANILFSTIRPIYGKNMEIGSVVAENGSEKIKLSSKQSQEYDIWAMQYFPYGTDDKQYKLSELATMEKGQMPQQVAKENQQYRLCLQYEYIGSGEQGNKILKRDLEEFNKELPMGYTAQSERESWGWGKKDNKQYLLLLVVIAIIFFTTSILFNSLKQPLAIIFIIPVSYIGVFLTFYWFKLNFDQGGFASFVLLCGITVNASIYILNEYNAIRRRHPRMSALRAYTKAWNAKILPIFLTVVSTILGFIPFMVGTDKEAFWFPLAAGTIGGLVMSIIGIFFFLPVFVLKKRVGKR
ncbi:efflux RND transporter permease subunit [Bacteroides fragilis]|uniref:efflux RND transporter permease subunit n=1 Tax=Bacteroides fragilis TaxID=817 RepID=UPI0022AA0293|nr:efflux RND transporter permease subunit [Bacteroides fragilis]MCZ2528595.1 efflux RND transporter permease subunit [Bacteroides fragilis]